MEGRSSIRAMKHVYNVIISGQTIVTTVTNEGDAVTEWINVFKADGNSGVRYVGFEVELNNNLGPIGTVQLCVGRRCLVIQLVSPWPPSLDQFLRDSNNVVVGVKMEDKLKMLRSIGVELTGTVFDLVKNVPSVWMNKQKTFGKYGLEPGTVENDWGRLTMLSEEQVQYACVDAFLNFHAAAMATNLSSTGSCNINIRAIKHVYNVTISRYTMLATVTNHPDAITEWINGVKADGNTASRKVAFEIELHDIFPPIGTVQLCTSRRCLVIQLVPDVSPFPWSVSEFLGDSKNIFMGFLLEEKVNMLKQQAPIKLKKMQTVDLMKANEVSLLLNNKQKMFGMYGLELEKVENDWGRTTMLSDEQVQYACIDAFLNLKAAIAHYMKIDI